jgi:16S rRNA (adenine1518-N6/adenine1519-N6)-dimethyltransferase
MTGLDALPPLREVIARHGLSARRKLGQHFLLDLNLTGRIARAAGDLSKTTVVEIGPGPGGLTRALLLEGAAHVVAIELDPRAVAALGEVASAVPGQLSVIEEDALSVELPALLQALDRPPPHAIVANLPYNVGTPLLLRWLAEGAAYDCMVLMFQREVADRLVAEPRTKAYGRLSVMAQWAHRVEPCFNLPAGAFTPAPKVASSVVRLTPLAEPVAPTTRAALEIVAAAAFGQRRKMLRQSLKTLNARSEMLLDAAGIDGTRRAEELSVVEFAALARAYDAQPA